MKKTVETNKKYELKKISQFTTQNAIGHNIFFHIS